MIERWKNELNNRGFEQQPGDKKSFARGEGFFRQTIWEGRNRTEKNKALIYLAVSLHDRFLQTPDYIAALVAHLRTDEVASVDEGGGRWWEESEAGDACATLLKHGVRWLEEYSEPRRMIDYLEGCMRDGVREERGGPGGWGARVAERLFFRQQGLAGPSIRRPPVYNYYLALVYNEVGDFNKACQAAHKWLAHVEKSRQPGEPQRTLHQLSQMACPQQGGAQ